MRISLFSVLFSSPSLFYRKWFSTDEGKDPDVILVGIGAETTQEVVEATKILRKDAPQLRVRMINITDLMVLDMDRRHPHALSEEVSQNYLHE
jgi:xylulose-5-phosphate/fructose-6-phosphate phosphoketolase